MVIELLLETGNVAFKVGNVRRLSRVSVRATWFQRVSLMELAAWMVMPVSATTLE